MKSILKNWLFTILGGVSLLLGVAGIFLPLLPATPFLLLAGFFFGRGSPKFHQWLVNHKHLGVPIRDWENRGVIRRPTKVIATSMLAFSAVYIYPNVNIPLFGKIGFSVVATGVLIFIWTRPSH